jgi:hypothetical protein
MNLLLGWFGYVRVPRECLDLVVTMRKMAKRSNVEPDIQLGLKTLENWFRSGEL